MSPSPVRVALVGLGPRGLGALERLIAHQAADGGALEVTIFEPARWPGVGAAYALDQPAHALMNFPSARIDLSWTLAGSPLSSYAGRSFASWIGIGGQEAERHYAPRAAVGRYLAEAAAELIAGAPFPVSLGRSTVVGLERRGGRWWARSDRDVHGFDEVLLALGHAERERSPHARRADQLPAGGAVSLRGFGLTAIDLILELTEGRGGRFEPGPSTALRYEPGGAEPATIVPWTRSGRPMLVKPEASRGHTAAVARAIERSRAAIAAIERDDGAIASLGAALARLAASLLAERGPEPRSVIEPRAACWLADAARNALPAEPDPLSAIAASLHAAQDEAAEADLAWGLGAAWRESYPAVVARFSHGGLRPGDHGGFLGLAAELERLAFGPPPVNARKLLALAAAGVLDLSRLAGGPDSTPDSLEIDAVSEPPGVRPGQPPIAELLRAGAIRTPPGSRGIEVTDSAACVGAGGSITPGLSAIGRLTEDWIIGNDTLNRALHPEVDRWAGRICVADRDPLATGSPVLAGS